MNASDVYQDYLALKAHFSSKYNYQQYEGKIRTSPKAVSFVRDKLFFEKVGKHRDPHTFLLANIVNNKKAFIRTIAYSNDAERLYIDHSARIQSLSYIFKEDLKRLSDNFDSNIKVIDRNHPRIVVLYLGEEITLETLCIIISITNCLGYWEKHFADDPVMNDLIFKIRKYMPFINYDRDKFKKAIVDEFNNR